MRRIRHRLADTAVAAVVAGAVVASVVVAGEPAAGAQGQAREVVGDASFPTNLAFLPDGTLMYTEKETGSVRVVTPDGELVERPFVTLPVEAEAERGLLGIAVHPDFPREPWIYLYRSDPADGSNRLVRVRADGVVAAGEPQVLLDGLSSSAGYHNGGDLAFAQDGTLFVALGEAHEPERAQDPEDLGGKIVRLADDGSVPADNPFGAGNPAWSIGHRNSFGLCVDPATGRLWETENGPDRDDEVNLIERGENYGWPVVTGVARDERFRDPDAVFDVPIAVTGCAVVGEALWFGSFDGRLWRTPLSADGLAAAPQAIATFETGVTDVAVAPGGDLFVATADAIWRLDPAAGRGDEPTPTPAPSPTVRPSAAGGGPDAPAGGAWRTWIAIAAAAVLAGALVARAAAGRRLRGDRRQAGRFR